MWSGKASCCAGAGNAWVDDGVVVLDGTLLFDVVAGGLLLVVPRVVLLVLLVVALFVLLPAWLVPDVCVPDVPVLLVPPVAPVLLVALFVTPPAPAGRGGVKFSYRLNNMSYALSISLCDTAFPGVLASRNTFRAVVTSRIIASVQVGGGQWSGCTFLAVLR